MKYCKKILSHADTLFPLSFVFSSCLNLCFFYLGLAFEENSVRGLLFLVGGMCFAIVCGLCFLSQWRRSRFSLRSLLPAVIVLLYFGVSFAVAVRHYGLSQLVVSYAEKFIVFCVPALMAGYLAGRKGSVSAFFRTLESFSFVAFPGALMYLNAKLVNSLPWNNGASLGIMNYMNLAYTFMPFLLAHLINFAENDTWNVFFSKQAVRRPQLWRLIFIFVYWLAIIGSGTRGVMVCVAIFCCALVLVKLFQKHVRPVFLVSSAMAAILLFNIFVYAPAGFNRLGPMRKFLDGLAQHELITSYRDSPEAIDMLDDIVSQGSDSQLINLSPDEQGSSAYGSMHVANRGTLFRLAWKEFQKAPLLGMGPIAFRVKYGLYPHNVALEVLCETGLVGAAVIFGALLYILILLLRRAKQAPATWLLFAFFLAYGVEACISNSLWIFSPLLGILGYGFGLAEPADGMEL